MIKIYLFFIVSMLCYATLVGQSSQTDSLLSVIGNHVKIIEDQKNWDEIKDFQIENFTSKEAFLKVYCKENNVQKIVLKGLNRHSELENTYYVGNNQLIYVLERTIEYIGPLRGEHYNPQVDEVETYDTQSYFVNEKLIGQQDTNSYGRTSISKEYLKVMGESILEDFKLLLAAAESQN